jgi:hypothetical protein
VVEIKNPDPMDVALSCPGGFQDPSLKRESVGVMERWSSGVMIRNYSS